MKNFKKKQDGFTLLELLVVVAILATIGGAVVGTFGNQEQNAAQGTATNTIAALENSVRIYEATQGQLPNDLETLACRPYNTATGTSGALTTIVNGPSLELNDPDSAYKIGGASNLNGQGGGLGKKLADKFNLKAISDVEGLTDAGITTVRYAATIACDTTEGTSLEMGVAAGVDAGDATLKGSLADIDIPNHMFESPRTGTDRNRGRGFSHTLVNNDPLMVWSRGAGGYNNIKVGADADDVLVGLGIGQASSMVGAGSEAMLAKAPFYGQIARDKYSHYIALVKVGTDTTTTVPGVDADGNPTSTETSSNFKAATATVVAIIDARGDFLDEEIAEFTDQKT